MQKIILVYFAAAIRGDRAMANLVLDLINFIRQDLSIIVLTEHLASSDPNLVLATKLGKEKINLTVVDIENQDITWLDSATHFIAEVSGASTGTGREVEYARVKEHFGKVPAKVLCIYQIDKEAQVSAMIRGMSRESYPNVQVESYKDLFEAKDLIRDFLRSYL